MVKTSEYALVMIVTQLSGYIAAMALVERTDRKAALAGFLAVCAAYTWFFGQSTTAVEVMVWGSPMSLFNSGT